MINIESLPKVISVNGNWYGLDLHITFKNRLCVGYQYMSGPRRAIELKIEYNIFSAVVEPEMDYPINYTDSITGIVDVPNIEMAWNVLGTRINTALGNGNIHIEFE